MLEEEEDGSEINSGGGDAEGSGTDPSNPGLCLRNCRIVVSRFVVFDDMQEITVDENRSEDFHCDGFSAGATIMVDFKDSSDGAFFLPRENDEEDRSKMFPSDATVSVAVVDGTSIEL